MNLSPLQELFIKKSKQILQKKGFKVNESKLFNGAFGFVFFIEDSTNNKFAAKAISLNHYSGGEEINPQLLSESSCEASLMSNLKHPNIIRYISHFQEGTIFFIIMERALMTLDDYIKSNFSKTNITEEQFFCFAGQLIDGIQFLHKKGIIIRDFKPTNVLVFPNNVLKLSDFGLTKRFIPHIDIEEYKQSSIKGSFMFFPPEIMQIINSSSFKQEQLETNPINQTMKGDLWALGISLLNLLGMKPFTSIALSCGYTEFENEPNASLKQTNL